jgi:small subunit ribosomal protein S20
LKKNKSAMKKAKQAEARRLRNSHVKSTMKTCIKKATSALEDKDRERLDQVFISTVSYINRAASKGVIHKNNAARKVARLSRKVHALSRIED